MAITDPRDISGLLVWLSAEAVTGVADAAVMTTWSDLSGNGNHATAAGASKPTWHTAGGPGGAPRVQFNSSGYFDLPSGLMTGRTSGQVAVTMARGAGDAGFWTFGSGTDHATFSGTLYDSFGCATRQLVTNLTQDVWKRYAAMSKSGTWSSWLDGASAYTQAGTTVAWPADCRIGASNGGSFFYSGAFAAFVLYDHELTTAERDDLDTWLTANPAGGTVTAGPTSTLAATLQAKTAAFNLATVLSATFSATLQPKIAAFTLDVVGVSTTTLAATLQAKTAAFTLDVVGVSTSVLAGTLQPKVAAFSLTAFSTAVLASTLQAKVASFTTYAVTPVTPAPLVVASAHSALVAQAFGAVTMIGTQPVYSIAQASAPRARQQIVVDGVDVTYFRNVLTPDVTYTLLEPLLYGPGTLELPQVSACFERLGVGVLSWLDEGATVEVHRVIDNVKVGTDYKGVIVAFDTSGRDLSVELGGDATGRAALRNRQAVIFPRVNDLGHQIADAVRDLGLSHYPSLGTVTGIEAMTTGGVGHLEHIQNLVAKAWTVAGKHWTVMPDEATGVYKTFQKDETTIHATAFLDDARTVANLRRDISEEPNRIFVTGVTPQGQRVRFGVYPGLIQGRVPDFPGLMSSGSTGEGVRLLIGKLHAVGYLRLYEVTGGYDFDVIEAVKDLQDDAGLPKTGDVNLVTWQALYDLNVTTTSLEGAHIEPAAQRKVVKRWNRSAAGTILEFNPDYNPEILPRDRNIDMGTGLNRSQMRRFARAVLYDSNNPNWVGDITFHTGALLVGNVTIGAAITAANVMDARALRPGMNLMLPQFDGGTLVHVAAVSLNGTVTATVDTRFRDALEVWDVIARNKESRNDPARLRNRAHRSSTVQKDAIGEWDEIGGLLGHDVQLDAGWNVFEVVGATEGTIARLRIVLGSPAEFAVAVFGRKVDRGFLDDIIGKPLTRAGMKAWETKGDQLDDRWLLYSAGTKDEPCGYFPGRKTWKSSTDQEPNPAYNPTADANTTGTDDTEFVTVTTTESFGTLTGKHKDDAGFAYRSESRTLLHVAVWVPAENTIPLGRIMWPQLEAGV